MRDKVSGAIAIPKGKLGMCPSLAEPDSGGFPKISRNPSRKRKLCENLARMLAF